ncbi:MAG TPA: hypothetical protein VEL69_04890 [Ktedonobacteraceae bacterium]|nr:hypothetical protein [Ktedonobacteraceae bacterium]
MSTGDLMRRLVPPGSIVLLLFFLAGIWLTISPFTMTTQPSGLHWNVSTINNVTLGAVLMVVSLLGIFGYMAFALRDLIRETQSLQAVEQEVSQLAE